MNQAQPTALSVDQLTELLRLIRGADSVELKLTVPDAHRRSTVTALGMDPLEAEIRQIVFFDTPDLDLNQRGVVVRARRVQRKGDDSVIKLRPVVPENLSAEMRMSPAFGVEVDAMPGGFVCSASFKATLGSTDTKRVLAGQRSISKLFTKDQRAFYRQHAPDGLDLDSLSALGPINVLKLKFAPPELGRRMVAEMWLYPDGSRVLELSTKCLPGEAFEVAAVAKSYLGGKGVDLAGEQQTKTRTTLEFFSREARESAPHAQS